MDDACLDEGCLQALVEGRLGPAELADVEAHIDRCGDCRALLAEVARALPGTATQTASGDPQRPLASGSKVGRFTVIGPIGAGAMGVVYEAHDPDLDRKIALKLVRSDRSDSGGSTRARVQREAKAIARLAHPNVVAVFEVGTHDGEVFLAMELVDGGTLRDALESKKLAPPQIIGLFVQAGRGIAAAHAVGLVHRDFKPDNVLIGKDGRARVCDFGLARDKSASDVAGANATERSALATAIAETATKSGTLLGTPAYMAPEQMRGERADARADIFGFAVALYEALYGARPFDGKTLDELRSNIEEGRFRATPHGAEVPEALRALVLRGLAARAGDRYQTIDEMLVALEGAVAPTPRGKGRARRAWLLAAVGVVAATTAVGVGLYAARSRRAPGPDVTTNARAQHEEGAAAPKPFAFHPTNMRRVTFRGTCDENPAFTPDGKSLVFDGMVGDDSFLYVMDLRDRTTRPLTRVEGFDYQPAVSPDGRRVAFRRATRSGSPPGVYVVDLDGRTEPRLVALRAYHPTFARDGRSVWVDDLTRFHRHDVETGAVLETLEPAAGMNPGRTKELEGGVLVAAFLHSRGTKTGGVGLYAADRALRMLLTGDLQDALAVTPDARHALVSRMLPSLQPELVAVPLDGAGAISLASSGISPWEGVAFAADGNAIAWSTCHSAESLAVLDAAGKLAPFATNPAEWSDRALAWVPGTTRVAVLSTRAGRMQPWILDRHGIEQPRSVDLGESGGAAASIAVSPDGATLAVAIDEKGIVLAPATGGGPPRVLTQGSDAGPSFTRDGRLVVFTEHGERGALRAMSVSALGGERHLLVDDARKAVASPADDLVAYLAGASGTALVPSIYRLGTGEKHALSPKLRAGIYSGIRFSPNGKRVGMTRGSERFIEVDVASGAIVREIAIKSEVTSCEYVESDVVCVRQQWLGALWMADDPL